jgi:hypothetical protein
MDLRDFVRQNPFFTGASHPEKIKAFGWFLHTYRKVDRFSASDIRKCYNDSDIAPPVNMNRFLDSLTEKRPPELLKDGRGYRLSQHVRERIDAALGRAEMVVRVESQLADLPGKIASESERLFLTEVLTCYRHGAFRAAIVMSWNLAYDHLVRWVLSDPVRNAEFNAGIPRRNPKKAHIVVTKRADFEELKEDEVVDIVGGLSGFSANIKRILKEKLGRRNTYAHPSILRIERAQVDDMITDLVNNVVLTLI